MLFPLIITTFFAATATAFSLAANPNKKTSECLKELEAAVYDRPSCAYSYMQRIGEELRAQSGVFWQNPQESQALIEKFMDTYEVIVLVADAMGRIMLYPGATPIPDSRIKARSVARANVYGKGFNSLDLTGAPIQYDYTSIYWGPDGQMYYVIIALLKENIPDIC